jgi:hypothetical protein
VYQALVEVEPTAPGVRIDSIDEPEPLHYARVEHEPQVLASRPDIEEMARERAARLHAIEEARPTQGVLIRPLLSVNAFDGL